MIPPPPTSTLFPYTTLFRSPPTRPSPRTRAPARQARRPDSHGRARSEEHTSELQSRFDLVCRLLLEKKKIKTQATFPPYSRTHTLLSCSPLTKPSIPSHHLR